MYDAIIVGARCAGAPTAMLLARQGHRVLLVDRTAFPSDIMSTHYIHQSGAAALHRWGLLDRVLATGCPPITETTFDLGPFALIGAPPPTAEGITTALCPRRYVLDALLVEAAAAAGAEVRTTLSVRDLLWEGERVVGIRAQTAAGTLVSERARVVVGADGLHSRVARLVEAPTSHEVPSLTTSYYSYWSDVPVPGLEGYPRDGRFIVTFPTHDGLTCVAVQWPRDDFHRVRAAIDAEFLTALELAPSLAERVRGGRRVARYTGTADLPNFLRQPFGPGWALVGDAGYHQDPNTGMGISNAFRDAGLLAEALHEGLSGAQPLDAALAEYEQRRDAAALPAYDLTCQLASLQPPPPEMQQLFGALRGNQADTDQFFGTIAGTVPIPTFFAPENTGRIVAAAGMAMAAD